MITVKAGTATGADIVDRHKALFAPGYCGRSEDTFNDAEGAFIANVVGPLRAIRSYIGANSGPYTQRTHVFYDQREDILTDLRVHAIPSVMDFWDYSPAASGMRYTNDRNLSGVIVDGEPRARQRGERRAPLGKGRRPAGDGHARRTTGDERQRAQPHQLLLRRRNQPDDDAVHRRCVCVRVERRMGQQRHPEHRSARRCGEACSRVGTRCTSSLPGQAVSVAQKHNSQVSNPLTFSATLYRG